MATGTSRQPDSERERWIAVLLRSVHLAGVVWVGSFVVTGQPINRTPALLMIVGAWSCPVGVTALIAFEGPPHKLKPRLGGPLMTDRSRPAAT